jgi:hypothetical protein
MNAAAALLAIAVLRPLRQAHYAVEATPTAARAAE